MNLPERAAPPSHPHRHGIPHRGRQLLRQAFQPGHVLLPEVAQQQRCLRALGADQIARPAAAFQGLFHRRAQRGNAFSAGEAHHRKAHGAVVPRFPVDAFGATIGRVQQHMVVQVHQQALQPVGAVADALVLLAHDVLEHGSHIGHHLGVVDGLKHIAKRAQLNGGARGLEVLVTADNHDTAARIAPADLLAELNAVHERHVQIGDEQIGLRSPLPKHGKRRAPVVRRHDLDLRQVLMKQKRQPLHHESLVISDQNPHSAPPFPPAGAPFSAG